MGGFSINCGEGGEKNFRFQNWMGRSGLSNFFWRGGVWERVRGGDYRPN